MRVVNLDKSNANAYGDFLKAQPEALFYASNGYRRLLRELLGASDKYNCIADSEGRITSSLPAFLSQPGDRGPVLNSLPFYGSNGGVMGQFDPKPARLLLDEFKNIAHDARCASATIITSPFDSEDRLSWYNENCDYNAQDERVGQVTFLPNSRQELAEFVGSSCHVMVRRAIKKARKLEIEIVANDNEGLSFVCETHAENMRSIGGIAKPSKFFDLVPKHLRVLHDYRVFTAFHGGRPVAALLLFYFNQTVEYFTPVIRSDARTHQPLSLIVFEAMADAIDRGFRRWNWGGTWSTQEGVYTFKKRWAAQDLHYRYFVKLYDRSLLRRTREDILGQYPNFYVLPFSMLELQGA